uniref:Uncharacterized protein n=1 Tax=Anguilla anguilla TaxID=7936 RepID=A0A0E9VQA3_ANGAN
MEPCVHGQSPTPLRLPKELMHFQKPSAAPQTPRDHKHRVQCIYLPLGSTVTP